MVVDRVPGSGRPEALRARSPSGLDRDHRMAVSTPLHRPIDYRIYDKSVTFIMWEVGVGTFVIPYRYNSLMNTPTANRVYGPGPVHGR